MFVKGACIISKGWLQSEITEQTFKWKKQKEGEGGKG